MNWHYVEQGKEIGPVSDEQFEELVRGGKINADTLVWHEGMTAWSSYREAKGESNPVDPSPTAGIDAPIGKNSEAVCAECGKIFPVQDMIRYGKARVCANCKPVFMQKLSEGAQINTGEMKYGSFGIRFGAKFIDGIIIRVVATALTFLFIFLVRPKSSATMITSQVLAGSVAFLITMAYTVLMNGKYGATLGKMACKIKIVTAEGAPITYKRAFGRFFAEILSGCPTLFIGYLMVGFDEQRRSLHDRICNTRVIYK